MKAIRINEATRSQLYTKYGVESNQVLLNKIINKCQKFVKKDQTKLVTTKDMYALYIDFVTIKAIIEGRDIAPYTICSFYRMAEKILGIDKLRSCCDV